MTHSHSRMCWHSPIRRKASEFGYQRERVIRDAPSERWLRHFQTAFSAVLAAVQFSSDSSNTSFARETPPHFTWTTAHRDRRPRSSAGDNLRTEAELVHFPAPVQFSRNKRSSSFRPKSASSVTEHEHRASHEIHRRVTPSLARQMPYSASGMHSAFKYE